MFAALMALNDAISHIWAAKPFQLSAAEFPIIFITWEHSGSVLLSTSLLLMANSCKKSFLSVRQAYKTLKSQSKQIDWMRRDNFLHDHKSEQKRWQVFLLSVHT